MAGLGWRQRHHGVNLAFLGIVPEERRAEIRPRLEGLERKWRPVPSAFD
jgi:hypothetical protein